MLETDSLQFHTAILDLSYGDDLQTTLVMPETRYEFVKKICMKPKLVTNETNFDYIAALLLDDNGRPTIYNSSLELDALIIRIQSVEADSVFCKPQWVVESSPDLRNILYVLTVI